MASLVPGTEGARLPARTGRIKRQRPAMVSRMPTDHSNRFGAGLSLALFSAMAFGIAGPLAAGLLAAGWSPLGAVVPRVSFGAAALLIPALLALRGRWQLLRSNWRMLVTYGLLAVAVPQLCYFNAVQYLQVPQALLIQYLAPLALVGLLWARRGERPTGRTIAGSLLALGGLVLVLQVASAGTALDWRGLAWAFGALIGNAAYFVISSDNTSGLPPIVLAAGGITVCAITLWLVALAGLLPFDTPIGPVSYAGVALPWWVPLVALGVITSALSYVAGIFGARMLGTRLASFVGLSEVLFATIFSALLVGQILTGGQTMGAVLVMAGVVLVKLGESQIPQHARQVRSK